MVKDKSSKTITAGSLRSQKDRLVAAKLVAEGEVVGIFNRGVCALWFDGGNLKAVKKIWKIKGEGRTGRPIALTLSFEEFIPLIDTEALHEDVKNLVYSRDFKQRVGSLCFIRVPLKAVHQKSLPNHAKSFESNGVCMIQNWDAHGHTPTEQFLNEVRKLGVAHPGVTSMNITNQREIVDQKIGEEFCKKHDIPIFLKDPKAHPQHIGSYTIFTFGRDGIKLERDGNIPAKLFEKIFGLPVDRREASRSNYPQLKFPDKLFKNLTGVKVRQAILIYLQRRY